MLDEFELWLTVRTLQAEPRTVRTAARRAWNKAAREINGWPQITLSLQSRRGQLLLPFTAFPDSFQADVAAYRDKMAGHDLDALFGVAATAADDPAGRVQAAQPDDGGDQAAARQDSRQRAAPDRRTPPTRSSAWPAW